MAFSADGQWEATSDGPTARVSAVAFSADGTRPVTGGGDKAVRVWDVAIGNELLELPGVRGFVSGVVWDADDDRVLAADDALRVWSPAR